MTPDDLNPYRSPIADTPQAWSPERLARRLSLTLIVLIGSGGAVQLLVSFLQLVSPAASTVSGWMMPRFGWIGLIIGLNAVFGLIRYLKTGRRRDLLEAAAMLLFVGVLNTGMILYLGAMTEIDNPFLGFLPSAWAWSVASFLLSSAAVGWLALQHPPNGTGKASHQGDN